MEAFSSKLRLLELSFKIASVDVVVPDVEAVDTDLLVIFISALLYKDLLYVWVCVISLGRCSIFNTKPLLRMKFKNDVQICQKLRII